MGHCGGGDGGGVAGCWGCDGGEDDGVLLLWADILLGR